MKSFDRFSSQAKTYQKFRPTYPPRLFDIVLNACESRDCAWDCGTGNGQVAQILAKHFTRVDASDLSENQINQAHRENNIFYRVFKAEKTEYSDQSFDLITVAQAIHWFDFEGFYAEAKRVLKPNGTIAIWGYNKVRVNAEIDQLFDDFYHNVVGPYWDAQRKYVDDSYASIPFPFETIEIGEELYIEAEWTAEHFIGYLNSWSSVQNFIQQNAANPVDLIAVKLHELWGNQNRFVRFPIFMKLGKMI